LKEIAPGELMQQRRVRLGDILDDYCPRERRITNHVVVAMIDDQVKQTRCSTCQSDHEYKGAKVPPPRRKKSGALSGEDAETVIRPRAAAPIEEQAEPAGEDMPTEDTFDTFPDVQAAPEPPTPVEPVEETETEASSEQDEWPVHRPLMRAKLPRPEGQTPERKAPDFTVRPGGSGTRFDSDRNGKRHRGHRPARQGQGPSSGQSRFGGSGQGPGQGPRHGSDQRSRQGSGPGAPPGQRSGQRQGPGGTRPGQGRGPRQGSGPGRKRGR
jgi:hypothetical protein